jgi:endonuclease G
MAKFRTSHSQRNGSQGGGMIVRVGLFVFLLGGLFFAFNYFSGSNDNFSDAIEKAEKILIPNENEENASTINSNFLPTSTTGEVIQRNYFTLSYSEEHEQAEWIAYELTRESLKMQNVERTGDFRPDPKIRKGSASPRDYKGTGYDRGHLAPAGDMAFSTEAMSESFYMTNISPQIKNFNGGIWRELEENVRDWAMKFERLYVITGPVLTKGIRESIGKNEVAVPDEFYKVILDYTEPEVKAIAFIIPNEISNNKIEYYAVTIDQIEETTGIDFFHDLLDEEIEAEIESTFDISLWRFNDKRHEQRVNIWNKRK